MVEKYFLYEGDLTLKISPLYAYYLFYTVFLCSIFFVS